MKIVGLSAFYHESACCLMVDGALVAAAAEERFSRIKHDPRLPVEAFRFCLGTGGLTLADLDALAYYEAPVTKLSRQLWSRLWRRTGATAADLPWLDPRQAERAIRERLGWDGLLLTFPHHRSHAASAFFCSGYPEAATLTVDGVGEWATTTFGHAWQPGHGPADEESAGLEQIDEIRFPHSLGLLYSTITSYLGFRVNGGEYKVMGLAPYGAPRYLDQVRKLVRSHPSATGLGGYRLDLTYFDFLHGERMDSPALWDLLGGPPRRPDEEIDQRHRDIARSVQQVLEEILLELVRSLHQQVPSENLCMAGGVALNCVANGRIRREGPFRRLFVQPAAGDAGGAIGAAALATLELEGRPPSQEPLAHVFLGPRWSPERIADLLEPTGLETEDYRGRTEELIDRVAEQLASGRIVGWFHGAMEMGPRALGARSILADPRDPTMRDRINRSVKRRESFRPFAPAVLAARAAEHFNLDHPSPFMLETCAVTSALDLPAVTHVDGSARPQTVDPSAAPRFAALLEAFERQTGCPILLNTSFNVRGEPIVCSPADALMAFVDAGLDTLVLEDFLIERESLPNLPGGLSEVLAAWRAAPTSRFARRTSAISETLYTFV